MAFLACPICHESGKPEVCAKCKHIEKRFFEMERRLRKEESFNYWLEQKFDMLVREVSSHIAEGKDIIPVPRAMLEDVLRALHKDAKLDRMTDLILIGMIVGDAADMLRAHKTDMEPKVRGMLKKHLKQYYNYHGWNDEKLEPGERLGRNIWDAEEVK